MFTINGNLTEFTQWEQGYSLTNPNMKTGDAVQFFSGAGDGSIMTAKEEDGVVLVEVPNVMLKHASNITARFVGGGDYTSFAVIGRKKPKDYVFIDNEYKEETPSSGGGGNSTYNVEYIVGEVIEEKRFQNNVDIKKVKFDTVTSINDYAFYGCNRLTEIDFPNVTNIDEYAFSSCSELTEIDFPNVTSIGGHAFNVCTALTKVNFPNVTRIMTFAFSGCSNLTKVNVPNVTSIGENAFYGCSKLTEIDLPNVTSIGNFAFQGCTTLKTVLLRNPNGCVYQADSFENTPVMETLVKIAYGQPLDETCAYVYVPRNLISVYVETTNGGLAEMGMPIDSTPLFRPLEDYTVDGTTTGELDESKI